jgi:hypothetical protein
VSGKRFAIKSLRDESLDDQEARSRFQHEARTWIKLDRHEHIVQALLYREVQGIPLLFLEYVEGPTLAELLQKDAPLAVAQAVEFAKQFCQAMSYVHGKGVIHRDIKPQNVLITRNCQVRVTDFGLAKVWGVTHGTRGAIGTPFYMSPEQIRDASKVDQRSDVFSFGAMLYQILHVMPRDPRQANPQVPERLAAIVLQCLEKDSSGRQRGLAAVASAVENASGTALQPRTRCLVCGYASDGNWTACPVCRGRGGQNGTVATGRPAPTEDASSLEDHGPGPKPRETVADRLVEQAKRHIRSRDWCHAFAALRDATTYNRRHGEACRLLAMAYCPLCRRRVKEPTLGSTVDYARFWRGVCPECETPMVLRL